MCSTPYSVQYIILHTLKILYLNNFGGEQVLKKLPYRTTQYFWTLHCKQCGILHTIWRIAHYLVYCTLHSTEHCNITGELTPAKITPHSCSLTTYKRYLVVTEVYTVLHTIWHTAHYMAYCTLNGVLHTAQHTIHCTPQHNLRLDPSKNKSTLLLNFFCEQDMFCCHRSVQCVVYWLLYILQYNL